ncbi:PH domain-containing protein [Demequina sp. TTPB684]|uniref:PH domain-containing protein n=1 Tax=unclassified Demequina TaxID=2620311 RepID=UPI001CF2119A|nr:MULTISPECIES: PH domain-containing protein [unclassified Demequina]MCB2412440.1 PH domain-containing protein [Demequina sp. TTPB684]UPU88944.1 PH domain-containing protein [Demequina sp. TMPB413]
MGIIEDGLAPEEELLLHRRKHWKTIIGPILLGLVSTGVAATLLVLLRGADISSLWTLILGIALGVVWLVAFSWWTIAPMVRWATTHFAITNRRLIFRTGVFTKTGIDIPIARINSVQFRHELIDRFFRTGTLIVESASDEPLEFDDIPRVEEVHAMLYDELNDSLDGDDDRARR